MTTLVLTYHSHNISGSDYATNDHVAFASDLRTLHAAGARIVALDAVVAAMREGAPAGGEPVVALTFDDGPLFDYADFVHPRFGAQRSFLNVMRDFQAEYGAAAQPGLHATSFVIASPEARRAMEKAPDCGYPEMDGWLTDAWWGEAVDTGLLGIGNHSWDHVHHAPERIAISSPVRDDFSRVDNYTDADREIRAASDYINKRVAGRCNIFAYPFGHVNDYLMRDYLPLRGHEHGMVAAVGGLQGRGITQEDSIWNIPRAVCGHHWRTPRELATLLR